MIFHAGSIVYWHVRVRGRRYRVTAFPKCMRPHGRFYEPGWPRLWAETP